jgi:hypothetical protein
MMPTPVAAVARQNIFAHCRSVMLFAIAGCPEPAEKSTHA